MIKASYFIDGEGWMIALHEGDMEITMPLEEAQQLVQQMVSCMKDIIDIEEDNNGKEDQSMGAAGTPEAD